MTDSILQNIPCGYLEFDDNGILSAANSKLSEWLGYERSELVEKHLNTLMTPGAKIFCQTHLFPLIKLQESVEEIYITLQTKEGDKMPVLLNAQYDSSELRPVSRCILVRMKNRSAYEERLLHDKKEAKKIVDKKEQLLSRMSHEIRNPLNVILGMVDVLLDKVSEKDDGKGEEKKYLNMIEDAGTDLARLADDILNFAKLESGYFNIDTEPVDLGEVLDNASMMAELDAREKNITISKNIEVDISVKADIDRLKQIIMNLLTNAVKYTKPGGKIFLSCRQEGESIEIAVKDTGIGIPPGKMDQIFQPFIQIDDQKSESDQAGFGLGLPISKKLAQMMNGDLTVASTHGEGSVFTLELPKAK